MAVFFCSTFFCTTFFFAFGDVNCSLAVTCWEKADFLALLCVMFLCFVTFQYGVLGQVWYLIV